MATPKQAFEALKILYGDRVTRITKSDSGGTALSTGKPFASVLGMGTFSFDIDWPAGVTQYPTPEKWEEPVLPKDYGKPVRFRDTRNQDWVDGEIEGFYPEGGGDLPWLDQEGVRWEYCEINRTEYP